MGVHRNEIDDGLAILTLLGTDAVTVIGITTTYGNGDEPTVYSATRRLLVAAGRTDIPVVRGARHAGDYETAAASFIVQAARRHGGRLVVLAIGPLTNIAAALQRDPTTADSVDRFLVMGGYLGRVRFPRRAVAELNFSSDPAAAAAVLTSPAAITIMSAQLCLQARYGVHHLLVDVIGTALLGRLILHWFLAFSVSCGVVGFYLWDLVPAWAVFAPSRFDRSTVEVLSTRTDLQYGRLRTLSTDGIPERTPRVVNLPRRIRHRHRFAADCARRWRRVPVKPARWEAYRDG